MNQYTIVGIGPSDIDTATKKLRKQYGEDMSEVKDHEDHFVLKDLPHFAVKRTFYLNDGVSEQDLFAALDGFTFEPIEITSTHLGEFPKTEYGHIVFAELNVTPEFRAVHEDLVKRVAPISRNKFPQYEREGYRAHISLCYYVPNEKLTTFQTEAQKLLPFTFTLSKLYLFRMCNPEKDELELLKEFSASKHQ